MMKIEPSILPSLAWFALIVRAGSFSRAASEMGITRAALSQNLKSLEERLNTKLIYRTTLRKDSVCMKCWCRLWGKLMML